jgi:thioredoxin 1
MGHTVEVTTANFQEVVDRPEGIVFIDFWAPWCGPCRSFAPTFERVAAKHPDLTFAKIDTEDQPELARAFGIRSIPTLMIFRDGVPLFAQPGALPEAALEDLVRQARALDMAKVKADLAAAEAKERKTRA